MTGYLIRRAIQMAFVVLLATMAIYALLNLAPGGPLSGLNVTADVRQRYSEADKARLEAYMGLDKPPALRYVTWLLGEDWLGADKMYLGLNPPEEVGRFYAKPGVPYAQGGYPLWVLGEYGDAVNEEGLAVFEADKVWIRPDGEAPDGAITGEIIEVRGRDIKFDAAAQTEHVVIRTGRDTEWVVETPPEPSGAWVDVSWLFGPYGLLGRYAGFHGDARGVLRFDLGTSWSEARGQPVSMLIMSRMPNTLTLMTAATIVSLVVAVPIGIYSAVKQYSLIDYFVTTFAFFGTAMPVFWLGLMMILVFSIKFREWGLPYLPAGGVTSVRAAPSGSLLAALNAEPGGIVDQAIHLIMPTLALSLLYMAAWSRYMRSSMLEVLRLDYVRTARAKGLGEKMVIVKHAMRNALIPLITIVVFQIPGIFGGATLTETIFSWQGMGRLFYSGLIADDWPVVMALLYINALLVVVATLAGDILYTVVDPRIRYD
jgi:peptide/nickel transport system permease protein